jgi:hypothetical protein
MALTDFLTIIVPYYCVIDREFMMTLTCQHMNSGASALAENERLLGSEFAKIYDEENQINSP